MLNLTESTPLPKTENKFKRESLARQSKISSNRKYKLRETRENQDEFDFFQEEEPFHVLLVLDFMC